MFRGFRYEGLRACIVLVRSYGLEFLINITSSCSRFVWLPGVFASFSLKGSGIIEVFTKHQQT